MTPSDLNRQLALEATTRVADGLGGFSESWSTLGTLWARIDTRRGRLRGRGEVALSEVPTEIVVRGAPVGAASRPEPQQRFREGDRVWRILAVSELDPAGRYLRCDTLEEVAP